MVDGAAAGLLGGHVVRGAADHGGGLAHLFDGLGEAEVHDLHAAAQGEEEVRGLDVAVDDALAVRVGEALGHLDPEARAVGHGEALPRGEQRMEWLALRGTPW